MNVQKPENHSHFAYGLRLVACRLSLLVPSHRYLGGGFLGLLLLSALSIGAIICYGVIPPCWDSPSYCLDTNDFPCPKCPCPPGWNNASGGSGGPSGQGNSCIGCSDPQGMPVWWVSEPGMNLFVTDEPLGYQPSVGPRVSFLLNYKQRENKAGYNAELCNVGTNWSIFWVSYVQDPGDNTGQILLGKGGYRTMTADGVTLDYYTGLRMLRLTDVNSSTTGYHLLYPDGSKDVYTGIPHKFSGFSFTNYFLTAKVDPDGNQLTFNYDTNVTWAKLIGVVDADNRTTTLSYGNANRQFLITSVTDPFGRTISLSYDSTGLLTNIVDVAGLTNGFTYITSNAWINAMITPYGTTSFKFTSPSTNSLDGRAVEITGPDLNKEIYVYRDSLSGTLPASYPTNQVPVTTNFPSASNFDNTAMYDRNSFYWSRLQYQGLSTNYLNSGSVTNLTATDYSLPRVKHWLKKQDGTATGRTQDSVF